VNTFYPQQLCTLNARAVMRVRVLSPKMVWWRLRPSSLRIQEAGSFIAQLSPGRSSHLNHWNGPIL